MMSRPFDVSAAMRHIASKYGATDEFPAMVVDIEEVVGCAPWRGGYGRQGVSLFLRRYKVEFPFNFFSLGGPMLNSCRSEAWRTEDAAALELCDAIVKERWGDLE